MEETEVGLVDSAQEWWLTINETHMMEATSESAAALMVRMMILLELSNRNRGRVQAVNVGAIEGAIEGGWCKAI